MLGLSTRRINEIQNFIKFNLTNDLNLEFLAQRACFSKFHFTRLFKSTTGEKLQDFIARARVEAAAFDLMWNPQKAITRIALDKGFSGSATFSRAFQKRYGLSPSQWRKLKRSQKSNLSKVILQDAKFLPLNHISTGYKLSNRSKVRCNQSEYTGSRKLNQLRGSAMNKKISPKNYSIQTKKMPEFWIAYVRHRGAYNPGDKILFQSLFAKLMAWANPKNLFNPPETKALTVYSSGHPATTQPENLAVDVCISIDKNISVSGDVDKRAIPAGTYAILNLNEVTLEEAGKAVGYMFNEWLPNSGYETGVGAYYCQHLNDPEQHPKKLHCVDFYLPISNLKF